MALAIACAASFGALAAAPAASARPDSGASFEWGAAIAAPGFATLSHNGLGQPTSISCAADGDCSAGGFYEDGVSKNGEAFVIGESGKVWGQAQGLPSLVTLNTGDNAIIGTVSCAAAGNCSVAGQYKTVDQTQVWVASQHNGGWGVAGTVAGLLNLNTAGASDVTGLSCATVGSCGMVGYYFASADSQLPFVASGSIAVPTATALALSATKVTYGHERAEKLSVTVTAVNGEPVTGTVKVKAGSKVVCSVTLSAGHGSCKPAASALKPGTYSLVAQYGPAQEFEGSPSPAKALTVVK